jgi:hypothetical protein
MLTLEILKCDSSGSYVGSGTFALVKEDVSSHPNSRTFAFNIEIGLDNKVVFSITRLGNQVLGSPLVFEAFVRVPKLIQYGQFMTL